ncbi:TetR/AcrR family transcriptional regulator [Metabacillus sediminilitoris]|uniref:TetR/AcrR family transcriptional regulator n=1 Tax=Metabacillus sediminilitoris TaxID=2567941 RepID=UPI001454BD3A|nr:TetR/AcrR family transcriptional regulator [Metabacillus sediminilitoris]
MSKWQESVSFQAKELFQTTKHSLIELGYDGFTFSLLADKLNVARGTLYKYYENKDELISSFLVFEMNEFLLELKQIDTIKGFKRQFDFLMWKIDMRVRRGWREAINAFLIS